MEAHVDQDVNPQSVNPSTYDEHHPNMQAPTPQHPNPENEPSVFGPFGSTAWVDQLEALFRQAEMTAVRALGKQIQFEGGQGGNALQGAQNLQLSQALQQLFQRDNITAIRCTPQRMFVVETKDGATYESPLLRSALQEIPNLDLSQPFTLARQQGTSGSRQAAQASATQTNSQQNRQGGQAGQASAGSPGQGSARQMGGNQSGGQNPNQSPDQRPRNPTSR
jgi:hypothetical protein